MCKKEWTWVVGPEVLPYVFWLKGYNRTFVFNRNAHENSRVDEWGERA